MATLLIDGLELLVVCGHASRKLKATGDIVKHGKIRLVDKFLAVWVARLFVKLYQPLILGNLFIAYVDDATVDIEIALLFEVTHCNLVHLALA